MFLLYQQVISGTLLEEWEDKIASDSTLTEAEDCDPNCSDPAVEGENVEDPKDCHRFYVCYNKVPQGPFDCPDGHHFDTADCVEDGDTECKPKCEGATGTCEYECDAGNTIVYIADRYDCSTYRACSNDAIMQCGTDKPFFDGVQCQSDESKCCHCNPYCYAADVGKTVMDPTDCTKYYLCKTGDKFPEISGHCSSGNYDPFLHECSLTAPCLTFCTNVVKPDGCIDVYTCQKTGKFAKCPHLCVPEYYNCQAGDIGSVVKPVSCSGDEVFDPKLQYCVKPASCTLV